MFSNFSQLIITEQAAGGFNEPGINGNAFIDGEFLAFELAKYFGVELILGQFGEPGPETREGGVIRGGLA